MKNIHEILKEFGLEVPADKKADFDKAWKENYRTKSEYDNAVTQRDNYKTSLDDVNTRLKEFEGVDVKDLQGQITKLQGDLQAKDAEYAAKEADRQFHDSVKDAIRAAGGRNEKAVMAMLDMDTLKESKNQSEDIKKALEEMKKSDGYLFGAKEPINNPEVIIWLPSVLLWVCRKQSKKEVEKYGKYNCTEKTVFYTSG